ncbi:hypothetical protein D3C73_1377370 [compost metagenome]
MPVSWPVMARRGKCCIIRSSTCTPNCRCSARVAGSVRLTMSRQLKRVRRLAASSAPKGRAINVQTKANSKPTGPARLELTKLRKSASYAPWMLMKDEVLTSVRSMPR